MQNTLEEWLGAIRSEYLKDFIKRGGAAVKFCILDDDGFDTMGGVLRDAALREGYAFASVSAVQTRISMIDKIFHAIARQIDWDALADTYVRNYFVNNGYVLPENGEKPGVVNIAMLNNRDETFFRRDVIADIERDINHDYGLCQEFRFAMRRLCINALDSDGPAAYLSDAVKDWLRGDLRLVSSLKEALIFQKVTRYNARAILYSLAHWLRMNQKSGLVLALDISRLLELKPRTDADEGFYYSSPSLLDAYEILRQFIDGTDEMEGLMIVVLAPREFLTSEKRGIDRYDALKMRVWNEVQDAYRQNPLTSLVRLTGV